MEVLLALLDPQMALMATTLVAPTKFIVDIIKVNSDPPKGVTLALGFLTPLILTMLLNGSKAPVYEMGLLQRICGDLLVALTAWTGAMILTEVHKAGREATKVRRISEGTTVAGLAVNQMPFGAAGSTPVTTTIVPRTVTESGRVELRA